MCKRSLIETMAVPTLHRMSAAMNRALQYAIPIAMTIRAHRTTTND